MTSTFKMGHFLTRKHFGEFDNNINSKAIMKLLGKPHQARVMQMAIIFSIMGISGFG